MHIRRGRPQDLCSLMEIEAACFEPERRDSRKVIANGLTSPHQEVWIAWHDRQPVASLTLRFHRHCCRIHSIAVLPTQQGGGMGRALMEHAHRRARQRGCRRMHLEADARNRRLISWYRNFNYTIIRDLPDYYAAGWNGVRMEADLTGAACPAAFA